MIVYTTELPTTELMQKKVSDKNADQQRSKALNVQIIKLALGVGLRGVGLNVR